MRFLAVTALALLTVCCLAESRNPADYPLRIHIFSRSQTSFYHHEWLDAAKGEGRANLFEGSDVHGVDFNYDCEHKLRASFGYETYSARWKKPGKKLEVLFPVFGKTNAYWTCDLNTDVKDFTYTRGPRGMGSEPEQRFLQWMARHDYDPVHGKNVPTRPAAEDTPRPVAPHS